MNETGKRIYFTDADREKQKEAHRKHQLEYSRRPEAVSRRKQYLQKYWCENREKIRAYWRRPDVVKRRRRYMRGYMPQWIEKNKENITLGARKRSDALKREVYAHYGGGAIGCCRCGFGDIRALSIDHINGGGNQHRVETGRGNSFWRWLKKNNYPSGFQILCMNCQFIKRYENKELEVIK